MLHIILILLKNLSKLPLTASNLVFFVIIPLILWLLKWIGILALIVLGLIVFVALLALLVPVRYRVNGSWHKKGKGKVRITWLLHILSITAAYDQKLVLSVRIFGYPVLRPGKNEDELHGEEDFVVQAMEVKEPQEAIIPKSKPAENKQRKAQKQTAVPSETMEKQPDFGAKGKRAESGTAGSHAHFKEKGIKLLTRLKKSFQSFCNKLKSIKEKKEEILRVLNNKENQKTIRLLFKQGKRALGHVLPVKGYGRLTFGFEDPYLTGQVLMAASAAYPFYHKRLELIPVFDQNVFQGEGAFRGRIRLGTLIVIGLRLLLHKNFRTLLKKWLR